jgi:hypothetical protein
VRKKCLSHARVEVEKLSVLLLVDVITVRVAAPSIFNINLPRLYPAPLNYEKKSCYSNKRKVGKMAMTSLS